MVCTPNACKLHAFSVPAFTIPKGIIAKRLGRGWFRFSQVAAGGLLGDVKPEDLEAFGLIPALIGRLPVITPLDALGVDDLARILQSTKGSLIQQFRKLVKFHRPDLVFTEGAVREIVRIAWSVARVPGGFGR